MKKQVIIGIHGLGNKPSKDVLQQWWKESMLEGLADIGSEKQLPHFELIYWADILHKIPLNELEKDKNSPQFLDEPYKASSANYVPVDHSFRQKMLDFITDQLNKIFLNKDKTLNYSFITHALLKKYFTDLDIYYNEESKDNTARIARHFIRERVAEVIKKYADNDIMIIAHSMGSIITFDVLNFMVPDIKINTLVTIGSPLGLPFVVSQIAAEHRKNHITENFTSTPPGITGHWFNFADIMDYVALNYKLSDDFSKNAFGVAPEDFLVNNNYEVNGIKNYHKSFGYLRAKEFSQVLAHFINKKQLSPVQKIMENVNEFFGKIKDRLQKQKTE